MHLVTRMAWQPGLHLANLVRAVVVHHQVNFEAARQAGVNLVQKAKELLMPVATVTAADGDAAGHAHGRKQRSDAVAFIVMRWFWSLEAWIIAKAVIEE